MTYAPRAQAERLRFLAEKCDGSLELVLAQCNRG
jgi:hypothetical protein